MITGHGPTPAESARSSLDPRARLLEWRARGSSDDLGGYPTISRTAARRSRACGAPSPWRASTPSAAREFPRVQRPGRVGWAGRAGKGGWRISFGCVGAGARMGNGVIAPLQDGRGVGRRVKDKRQPPFPNVRTLTMNSDTGESLGPVVVPAGSLPVAAARPRAPADPPRSAGARYRSEAPPGSATRPRARRGTLAPRLRPAARRDTPALDGAPLPTWGAAGTGRGYTRTEADAP